MRYFLSMLLFALSSQMASAAITITIAPDDFGGTTFLFSQTTANPSFPISNALDDGFSIALPPSMFNPTILGGGESSDISGPLIPFLATFTDSGSGFIYDVSFLVIGGDLSFAEFRFDRPFSAAPNQIEGQLDLLPGAPVSSGISPMALVPGTHTVGSSLFDSVTVIVIPEPASFTLLIISTIFLARRHRSHP